MIKCVPIQKLRFLDLETYKTKKIKLNIMKLYNEQFH